MNQPRKAFATECHSWVKIQPDLWQDWSRNNSVSLSTARGRKRSRTDSGTLLVSHWYHWNKQNNLFSWRLLYQSLCPPNIDFLRSTAKYIPNSGISYYTIPILKTIILFLSFKHLIIFYSFYSAIYIQFYTSILKKQSRYRHADTKEKRR